MWSEQLSSWWDPPDENAWHVRCTAHVMSQDPTHYLTSCQAKCEAHLLQKAYGCMMSADDAAHFYLSAQFPSGTKS